MTYTKPGPTPDTYYECFDQYIADIGTAAVVLKGFDAALFYKGKPAQNYVFPLSTGTAALTGFDVKFTVGRKTANAYAMKAETAKFAVTGNAAKMARGKKMVAGRQKMKMQAETGKFTIS